MASGTKVADVFVDIGYDLTNYRKGLAQAKTEAGSIGGQIRSALSGGTGGAAGYTSGFARVVQDIRNGTPVLAAFRANSVAVASDLGKLTVSGLTNSLSALGGVGTRIFGGLRSLATNVFKGIALGAGIGAFLGIEQVISRITQAIPDLIAKGREYAETVHAITLETGANAEAASKALAIYQFFGGTAAQFETQIVRLSARVQSQEKYFHAMGVATRDAFKEFLNPLQIVENVRKAFEKLGDGTAKTGFLFKAFGQRGAQAMEPLIHFVGQTDEQIRQLGLHVTEQGLVITDAQEKIADAVTRAQNNMGNAITGFATQLFLSFGPALSDFFDSLAEAITRNATQIQNVIAGITGTVIGLIEGLVGMSGSLSSFSDSFAHVDVTAGGTSTALRDLEQQLVDLEAKSNPAADAAKLVNDAIDKQTKALDREGVAIDKQIVKLNAIGVARDAAFKKGLDALTRSLDLETQLFDAEDKAAQRADQDLAQTKALRQAKIDLFEAQAQLRADALAGKSTDQDQLNIAKAQQAVLDAQKTISDEVRTRAEEDRRTQIAAIEAYVAGVEKLTEADNKRAALANLRTRKAKLEEEIAAATGKGSTQEVSDLKVKLAAVEAGITEENAKIKQASAVDELTARKQQLADEKTALQAEKTSEAEINDKATRAAIANVKAEIAAEQDRLARLHTATGKEQDDLDAVHLKTGKEKDDLVLITKAITDKNGLSAAFDEARDRGVAMADDWKTHLGGVVDAINNIASALGGIFKGLIDAFNGLPGPLQGIVAGAGVAALASGGNPFAIAAAAIAGGVIQLSGVNAANDAQRAKILTDAREFARTGSLSDLQNEVRALQKQRDAEPTNRLGGHTDFANFLQQVIAILQAGIVSKFAGGTGSLKYPLVQDSGGWHGTGLWMNAGPPEYVLDNRLSTKLDRFFSAPQMPALAMAGMGVSGQPVHLHFEVGGRSLIDYIDERLSYRTGRGGRQAGRR